MKYIALSLLLIPFVFLTSCQSNQTAKTAGTESDLTEVNFGQASDTALVDLTFDIIEDTKTDSTHIYTVQALNNSETVGFQIEIDANIPAVTGTTSDVILKDTLIANAITFRSIGENSNALLDALATRFGLTPSKSFATQAVHASVFPLNTEVAILDNLGEYSFQLYFPEAENTYAPMLNLKINTNDNKLELKEVDAENRAKLIELFSQQ
ncbi:hypothetical protein [Sphingobacterium hungaricum]